jgi:hypothetical protein
MVRKLPLFGKPRTRRRFGEQYYAVRQKRLLDAGVIWCGRWASIVLAFPKTDGAFVDRERRREVSLCHAGKSPRRAQLPTSDKIVTPIGHGRLTISCEKDSIVGAVLRRVSNAARIEVLVEEIPLPPKWRGVRFEINPLLGTVKSSSALAESTYGWRLAGEGDRFVPF